MSQLTRARSGSLRPPQGQRVPTPTTPRKKSDGVIPWLFIAPAFIGIVLFYLWPVLQTAGFSFQKFGPFGGGTFSGLENYRRIVTDPEVPRAFLNTAIYSFIVLLGVPIALYFASLINRPGLRFATFYRVMFFLPYVAMPAAIAIVWRLIYNGDYGVLNFVLSFFGIPGPYWVSTEWFALVAVGLLGLWSSMGFNMIILSAGLKGVPAEIYEAAQIDGASAWRQFRSITIPLVTPSIFLVTIMTVIGAFQLYDLLFVLLGPSNPAMPQTQSLVYLFYTQAFVQNDAGYASALAMLVLVIIGLITLFQFRAQKRWVNYE
jgi:multiple sugar transport system permease protein